MVPRLQFLAIFAKWYPILISPIFLVHAWKQRRWKGILAYLPPLLLLLIATSLISPSPEPSHPGIESGQQHDEFTGLRTFLKQWEMNDLIFSVVRENLRVEELLEMESSRPHPWYAITPQTLRHLWSDFISRIENTRFFRGALPPPDFLGAQLVCGGILLLITGLLSFRNIRFAKKDFSEMGLSLFLVLAASWFLSATQNPWYWIWALPFLVFARSRVWLFVSVAALLYYARFWLIYHYPEPIWGEFNGPRMFDEVVIWIEHVPILLSLLYVGFFRVRFSSK